MLTKQFCLFFPVFFAVPHLPLDFLLFLLIFLSALSIYCPLLSCPGLSWQEVSLSRREASFSHLYSFTTTRFSGQDFRLPHISLCSDSLARAEHIFQSQMFLSDSCLLLGDMAEGIFFLVFQLIQMIPSQYTASFLILFLSF